MTQEILRSMRSHIEEKEQREAYYKNEILNSQGKLEINFERAHSMHQKALQEMLKT